MESQGEHLMVKRHCGRRAIRCGFFSALLPGLAALVLGEVVFLVPVWPQLRCNRSQLWIEEHC